MGLGELKYELDDKFYVLEGKYVFWFIIKIFDCFYIL